MKLILSSSPHAHAKNSVHSMMRDVILALLPATGCAVWFFGMRAVWLIATCIAASVVTEAVCRLAMKRENSIGDLSATLTGLLLALNLPPDLPLWMAAVGGVFAIAVAKQAFGGLGYNPFNPALAARAFMLISFTGAMTTWAFPRGYEAVEAATGWALAQPGVKRVYAETEPGNTASQRVLEKCGFVPSPYPGREGPGFFRSNGALPGKEKP